MPAAIGFPCSTKAMETQNSGMPATNSLVPSSGSTTQTRSWRNRERSSALSSDSQPSPARNRCFRSTASSSVSACVTGSWPALYSAAISPGVYLEKTSFASSIADRIRSNTSEYELLCIVRFSVGSRPEHSRPGGHQNDAQDSPEPQDGNAGGKVRPDQPSGNGSNQKTSHK